ncbi:Octicosapeptide/Phox/Bem1p family protein [Forsythia ovata]|uniref:Octicosapeptide/Phox/Bem1p family protein n=1 Tax=Forsythia ovata TaxID=205694 RepID=A0ABD1QKU4_9LAMI
MENYSYNPSYPESGGSSPRSREIEFENPAPWDDSQNNQLPSNYKVKFMCSYGGKIHPRPNDNQLSYIGGESKILAVDRTIKFNSLLSKLVVLCDSDNISFKYQLPGEDLDALISVTNDDDLEHMMNEYDRLYRVSPKPSRLRIFIFHNPNPSCNSSVRSFGSDDAKSEKERFVEALNSGPAMTAPPPVAATAVSPQPPPANNNMDYFFGLEKGVGMAPQPLQPMLGKVEVDDHVPGFEERSMGSDPIQQHIRDLERLRIEEQQGAYRRRNDDNLTGGFAGGDYYKVPEKLPPVSVPSGPPGYWPEKQFAGGVFPSSTLNTEQPVYMMYHSPMVRPMSGPAGQGYYAVQRMPSDVYRDQQVYTTNPSAAMAPQTMPPQAAPKMVGYSEGYGMVRPVTEAGYGQFAYDSSGMGRQMIYTAAGGAMAAPPGPSPMQAAQYQAMAAANADMRQGGAFNQEAGGKVVTKFTQNSG